MTGEAIAPKCRDVGLRQWATLKVWREETMDRFVRRSQCFAFEISEWRHRALAR
jgi:hypothetical protein